MKRKIMIGLLVTGMVSAGVSGVNALSVNSKQEKVAFLTTNNLVEEVKEEKNDDKIYEVKNEVSQEKVNNLVITEPEKTQVLDSTLVHPANCDGVNQQNHDGVNHNVNHNQNHNGNHR